MERKKMGKVYQSAQGKMVDMAVLSAKNERVRAVGNMNVNSRGDIIDNEDRIISSSGARVSELQSRSHTNLNAIPKSVISPIVSETIKPDEQSEIEQSLEKEFSEPNPIKEEPKKGKKR